MSCSGSQGLCRCCRCCHSEVASTRRLPCRFGPLACTCVPRLPINLAQSWPSVPPQLGWTQHWCPPMPRCGRRAWLDVGQPAAKHDAAKCTACATRSATNPVCLYPAVCRSCSRHPATLAAGPCHPAASAPAALRVVAMVLPVVLAEVPSLMVHLMTPVRRLWAACPRGSACRPGTAWVATCLCR